MQTPSWQFGQARFYRVPPAVGTEDDPARRSRVEHAVDDHAMEVQMRIEGGAEAVDEGDCAETCPDSAYASAKPLMWGFKRVYYFAGGFPAWKRAGYPVEVSPTK